MINEMRISVYDRSCEMCGKKEFVDTDRDEDGYHRIVCKNCGYVPIKYSDNGDSIEVLDAKMKQDVFRRDIK